MTFSAPRSIWIAVILLILAGRSWTWGQAQAQAPAPAASPDGLWQPVGGPRGDVPLRTDITGPTAVLILDKAAFDARLAGAPRDGDPNAGVAVELTLPLPDGSFARFAAVESPILAPELADAFPGFRTYRAQGLDNPADTARFGWTDLGFHAVILTSAGAVYVDPYARGTVDYYLAYRKEDLQRDGVWIENDAAADSISRVPNEFPISHGASLRTYRLALAATGEFTALAGGTVALALSRITATMNRVNAIFERDVAVRMIVSTGSLANPTSLIFDNGATDPYTNDNRELLVMENLSVLNAIIGVNNYDMGHVFGTSNGGWAYIGACYAPFKAQASSGVFDGFGDAFDVHMVSHEMAHQMGASHTFNGQSNICGGANRHAAQAYEIGSGSTILGYAGACGGENLQRYANDYFHVASLNEMTAYVTSGWGSVCGTVTATGNMPPSIAPPGNFTVPRGTPFTLAATATDANADALTYTWEQYNLGPASTSVATASTDDGTRPLFRSYLPSASPERMFPSLPFVLANANNPPATIACDLGGCLTGEVLPMIGRTLTFQVTARDNRSGGGGIGTNTSQVTIEQTAGPFRVTAPNSAVNFLGGSTQTITWDVNGTSAAPVGVANVRITLSTDGGLTFPTVVIASTPNDGSQALTIPNLPGPTARIRIEAVGNIFFDVSDANFNIVNPLPNVGAPAGFALSAISGNTATFTWSAGAGILPITDYLLQGGVAPGEVLGSLPIAGAGTSATLVLPTGAFYVRLIARSNGVASLASNEIRVLVNVPAPPGPPTNLLGVVNGSTLGLSWINPSSGGAPTGLVLDVTGTLAVTLALPVSEAFSFTGVPAGTYTFSVRAANGSGTSAGSTPVTLTFPGACSGRPQMPTNFTVEYGVTGFSLSWLPPVSGPAATSYTLLVSGAFNGTVPTLQRGLTGTAPAGTYTVRVRAENTCGSSDATAAQTLTVGIPACSFDAMFLDDRAPNTSVPGNCPSLPCGSRTIQLSASTSTCQWSVANLPAWLQIDGGNGPRTGGANLTMRVIENNPTGADRTIVFQVAGRPLTVRQCAGTCS